jgi:hypothetical protein
MEPTALAALADRFASAAVPAPPPPMGAASMAALQGHLMMFREDPEGAVASAPGILP